MVKKMKLQNFEKNCNKKFFFCNFRFCNLQKKKSYKIFQFIYFFSLYVYIDV